MSEELNDVLGQALKLAPRERLQLVEQLVASVEHELAVDEQSTPSDEHWGRSLNKLLDSLDMSDWESLEMDDPVAWVKQQRAQEQSKRLGDWGSPE